MLSAHRVTILLVILGLIGTLVGIWWSTERTARQEAADLASRGELLVSDAQRLLENVGTRVVASGSLFLASEHVVPDEFRAFVDDVGLMPGMLAIGYVEVVADRDLDIWLEGVRRDRPWFELFEMDDDYQPVALRRREIRYPLVYFEPAESFAGLAGLDLGYREDWGDIIPSRLHADGLTMTASGDLGLPAPLDDGDQYILAWPITDRRGGAVHEAIVSVIDLSLLLEGNVSEEITRSIDWTIADIATVGDTPAGLDSWQRTIDFGGRTWAVTATLRSQKSGVFRDSAFYPFVGGLVVTALLALVGSLLTSRFGSRRELESLESLNRGKDEFLASVSHRLRTPLTAVVGFSEILRDNHSGLTEMDRRELVSTIAVQAIELGHLFDNLLTVSRGTGRATFLPARVAVAAEINAVLDTAEPARRAKVRVGAADPDLVVAGDPGLVRQILRNLVANATEHGDLVEVSGVSDGHIARITVSDDGPGIPPDRVGGIFELYDHSSHDRGQPKTMGVGLFVSRRLARRMSGDITYRRSAERTIFELTLPAIPTAVTIDGATQFVSETVN